MLVFMAANSRGSPYYLGNPFRAVFAIRLFLRFRIPNFARFITYVLQSVLKGTYALAEAAHQFGNFITAEE